MHVKSDLHEETANLWSQDAGSVTHFISDLQLGAVTGQMKRKKN